MRTREPPPVAAGRRKEKRSPTMIGKKMLDAINKQITAESYSAWLYLPWVRATSATMVAAVLAPCPPRPCQQMP